MEVAEGWVSCIHMSMYMHIVPSAMFSKPLQLFLFGQHCCGVLWWASYLNCCPHYCRHLAFVVGSLKEHASDGEALVKKD